MIEKKFLNKVLIVWLITLIVVVFDVFIEGTFEKNILGYGGLYGGAGGSRIVFFKRADCWWISFGFYDIFRLFVR